MDLEKANAKWTLGILSSLDFQKIALKGMQQGYNGASLHKLATADPNSMEIQKIFKQALLDTGQPTLTKTEASLILCKEIVNDILSQKTHPYYGCLEIVQISEKADNPTELSPFITLECNYGSEDKDLVIGKIMEEADRLIRNTAPDTSIQINT